MKKKYLVHRLLLFFFPIAFLLAACGDSITPTPNSTVIVPPIATTVATTASATTARATTPAATTAALTTARATTPVATTAAPTTAPATTVAPTTVAATKLPGKLVFSVQSPDSPKSEIFTINPDGTERKKVAEGIYPVLSPDGTKIAFGGLISGEIGTRPMQMGVFSVDLNGENKKLICKDNENYLTAPLRWSPSGRFIAFGTVAIGIDGYLTVSLCNPADGGVLVMQRNGNKPATLYDWTPDGDNAVWQVQDNNTFKLYYGDPDKEGKDAVLLASYKYEAVGILSPYYNSARFSPDGKTIAYSSADKIGFVSVPGQKSPLDGKTINLAATNGAWGIAFSPDGKKLIAVVTSAQKQVLRFVSLEDADFGKLGNFADGDVRANQVDWSRK